MWRCWDNFSMDYCGSLLSISFCDFSLPNDDLCARLRLICFQVSYPFLFHIYETVSYPSHCWFIVRIGYRFLIYGNYCLAFWNCVVSIPSMYSRWRSVAFPSWFHNSVWFGDWICMLLYFAANYWLRYPLINFFLKDYPLINYLQTDEYNNLPSVFGTRSCCRSYFEHFLARHQL